MEPSVSLLVHNSQSLDPILNHMTPAQRLIPHFFHICVQFYKECHCHQVSRCCIPIHPLPNCWLNTTHCHFNSFMPAFSLDILICNFIKVYKQDYNFGSPYIIHCTWPHQRNTFYVANFSFKSIMCNFVQHWHSSQSSYKSILAVSNSLITFNGIFLPYICSMFSRLFYFSHTCLYSVSAHSFTPSKWGFNILNAFNACIIETYFSVLVTFLQ